ncbi:type II toxin-antitoxin system Phd/YefM family antitoxin [Ciceribacter azotifigens]|uniref:type II toxin-antitoxin system Phd/YefM family antitoxin n=1 Tax=Ciceribacter azotifigens TaxID=2069303 RepID=UPI003A840D84
MRQFTTRDLSKHIGDVTAAGRESAVLTRHGKSRFVLMSYEHYERMRAGGDPRRGHRVSEMSEEHKELFAAAIDRLANGEGCDADP